MDNEEEIRILRNAYAKEWRKNNPEKVKETNARFYKNLKKKKKQEINNNNK